MSPASPAMAGQEEPRLDLELAERSGARQHPGNERVGDVGGSGAQPRVRGAERDVADHTEEAMVGPLDRHESAGLQLLHGSASVQFDVHAARQRASDDDAEGTDLGEIAGRLVCHGLNPPQQDVEAANVVRHLTGQSLPGGHQEGLRFRMDGGGPAQAGRHHLVTGGRREDGQQVEEGEQPGELPDFLRCADVDEGVQARRQ